MTLPIDSSSPQALLDAGWRARFLDDRPKQAHEFFVCGLESALQQQDKLMIAKAMLALAKNLLWYCPEDIEEADLSLDGLYQEALELFREVGDESGVAACLRGTLNFDESLAICKSINDQAGVIRSLQGLANMASLRSAADEALAHCKEATDLARELDDKELLADVLTTAGIVHDDEQFRRTELLEAAGHYGALGYKRNRAECLQICAALACDTDLPLRSKLLEDSCAIWRELGRHDLEKICLDLLADAAEEVGDEIAAAELRARSRSLSAFAN